MALTATRKRMIALNGLFIDTWGRMAIANRSEPRHVEVTQLYQEVRSRKIPVYSSDYVLDEFITLIFRRETHNHAAQFLEAVLASAAKAQLRVESVNRDRFLAAWELRKRYHDKPRISFTDLTSMVIMSELGIEQVLTGDEHFMHVGMGFVKVP